MGHSESGDIIRHLSEIQQEIAFTEFDFYQRYAETFKTLNISSNSRCLSKIAEQF